MKRATPRLEYLVVVATLLALGLPRAEAAPEKMPGAGLYQLGESGQIAKVRADGECCTDPGAISECWWQDAVNDGVACANPSDCAAGRLCETDALVYGGHPSPNGEGLCECVDDNDCDDGISRHGVCDEARGICGPSYCNGYRACSCFGGCEDVIIEGHATPKDYCATQPNNLCCEHYYPKIPGTEQTGMCWDSTSCEPDTAPSTDTGECTSAADCLDYVGNICVIAACILNTCQYGGDPATRGKCFDLENGGAELTVNVDPIDPDPAKVLCCCTVGGDCPTDPCIAGATCNLDNTDTNYFHSCEVVQDGPGATCADATHIDAPPTGIACHWWACNSDVRRACEFNERNVGVDCEDPGAGRTNTDCAAFICRGADGSRDCEFATDLLYKQSCDLAPPSDVCGRRFCDDTGACILSKAQGDTCAPTGVSSYRDLYCYGFECDAAEACATGPQLPFYHTTDERENCTFEAGDDLGDVSASDRTASDDMTCAVDDMNMAGTADNPRFSGCNMEDISDFVYYYTGQTDADKFGLDHVLAYVEPTSDCMGNDWDPIIYTAVACGGAPSSQYTCNDDCDFTGTNFNDYSCGVGALAHANTAAVTAGPWSRQDEIVYAGTGLANDWDGNSIDDGFVSDSSFEGWVVVDSPQPTAPCPPGGDFTLKLEYNEHNNNSCWNTSSYMSTPHIIGQQLWKERWRGSIAGYENYICKSAGPNPNIEDTNADCFDDDKNIELSSRCWTGKTGAGVASPATETDPGQAFFRVDLPEGLYKAYTDEAGMMWSAEGYDAYMDSADLTGNDGTPYAQANFLSTVLATWGAGTSPDGPCLGAIDPDSASNTCLGGLVGYPRERVFDNGPVGWHGWLEVSNNVALQRGDYELNVLKVPQEFLGFMTTYAGANNGVPGSSCSCGDFNPEGHWNMEGDRLDMYPTDTAVTGYAVSNNNNSTGAGAWMHDPTKGTHLDPDIGKADGALMRDVACVGAGGANGCNRSMGPYELPFLFPYSGELWGYYCINGAGAIALRRNPGDSCPAWDRDPSSKKITGQYDETDSRITGHGPLIFPLWGEIVPCWRSNYSWVSISGADFRSWTSCRTGYEGRIVRQSMPFEGTMAEVITWDGFDGTLEPSRTRGNRADSLRFQVVLRVDGRISFYYAEPANNAANPNGAWDNILAYNGWAIGLSGTRFSPCLNNYTPTPPCSTSADCQSGYACGGGVCGRTEGNEDTHCQNEIGDPADPLLNVRCDNTSQDVNGTTIYTARFFCMDRAWERLEVGVKGP